MTVIKFEQEKHFEEINNWAKERGIEILPFLLSQNGFVVVDENDELMLSAWVYFVHEVPVIHIDHLISRPGLSIWEVRAAWQRLFKVIKEFIQNVEEITGMKYLLIRCLIGDKLSKEAARAGFEIENNPVTLCRYTL